MLLGLVSGFSPIPQPVPKAAIAQLFGTELPKPMLMVVAIGSHLCYGGLFGVVFARITNSATVIGGLILGIGLWIVMQVAVLPFLGWGIFGTAITPKIAVATLVLHLIYGGALGWLMGRNLSVPTEDSVTTAD